MNPSPQPSALPFLTFSEVQDILERTYSKNPEKLEEQSGIKVAGTIGKIRLYDKAAVLAYKQKLDDLKTVRKNNLDMAVLNNPKRVDLDARLTALSSGLEALRSEQGAAFNLMMDELSKIKCQLVTLEPTKAG